MNLNIINDYDVQIIKASSYLYNRALAQKHTNKKSIIFISSTWHCAEDIPELVNRSDFNKYAILANSIEEVDHFNSKVECDVLFCNNNAFTNENIFKINDDTVKIYDCVINNRFSHFKNVQFASLCTNSIHVGYYSKDKNYIFPNFGQYANFKNPTNDNKYNFNKNDFRVLSSSVINDYINKSITGCIFSSVEGACRASSEYLLAGVPVISTKSKGGRDIWYDDYNSIICDPNPKSVYECLQVIKTKQIDPEIIRNKHLTIADEHKNTLVKYIIDELDIAEEKKVLKSKFKHLDFADSF